LATNNKQHSLTHDQVTQVADQVSVWNKTPDCILRSPIVNVRRQCQYILQTLQEDHI